MVVNTIFTTFSIITIITSAAISDLDSVGKGSSFQDDSALSFNPALPWVADPPAPLSLDQSSLINLDDANVPTLFNSAEMSGDFLSATKNNDLDTSDAFLWDDMNGGSIAPSLENDKTNEPNFFDVHDDQGPFQLVDCSNSESLPAFDAPLAFDTLDTLPDFDIANSRLRRRDSGGEACTNPSRMGSESPRRRYPSGSNLEDQFRKLLEDPELLNRATTSTNEDSNHNTPCFVQTEGRLPWGVCSSGRIGEQGRLRETFLMASTRGLAQWHLSGATLGKFLQISL